MKSFARNRRPKVESGAVRESDGRDPDRSAGRGRDNHGCGEAGPEGFVPTELAWDSLRGADGPTYSAGEVKLLHPVVPGKLIGIGLNYRTHAVESQLDIPGVPVVFASSHRP